MSTMPALSVDDISVITEFFNYVDTDHDGFITISEIRAAVAVDTDADGTISDIEITASALPWVSDLVNQDADVDSKISLVELIAYNENLA